MRPGSLPPTCLKVFYLEVRDLNEYRGRNVGTRSSGWKQALQTFTIYFEGRIPTHDRHHHPYRRSDAPHIYTADGPVRLELEY
jgi:hypothetical protein